MSDDSRLISHSPLNGHWKDRVRKRFIGDLDTVDVFFVAHITCITNFQQIITVFRKFISKERIAAEEVIVLSHDLPSEIVKRQNCIH